MDWQTNDQGLSDDDKIRLIESLTDRFVELERFDTVQVNELDKEIAGMHKAFEARIKPTRDEMRSIMDRITQLQVELVAGGRVKRRSFQFKSGKVALRTSKASLVINDEPKAMKIARRHRLVKQVSVLKPRVLSKTLLMELFERRPHLIPLFKGSVDMQRTTRVTLTPATSKKNHYGELDGHQRRIVEMDGNTQDA